MERVRLKEKPEDFLDANGRFLKGNPGGPGNPFIKRVSTLRAALFAEVTKEDMQLVIRRLVTMAKAGDVAATKVLLDRVLGKVPLDVLMFLNPQSTESPENDYNPNDVYL